MRPFAFASAAAIALLGTAAIATQSASQPDHSQHHPTTNSSNTAQPAPQPAPTAPPPADEDAPEGNSGTDNTQAPPPHA